MVDPQSTPARARPSTVTTSSYLLLLFAITQLIALIMAIAVSGKIRQAFDDAFAGTAANTEDVGTFAAAFVILAAAVVFVLALALVVLSIFNNRGRNGTRITTWVLGGILVCCVGGNLISGATGAAGGSTGGGGGDAPTGEEIERSLNAALPSWFGPVTTLLGVLGLLALIAALILLALPKSNEFFRKPQQAWEPPPPGAGYPATPGYPQSGYPPAPGYPQAGYPQPGQPGHPAAPGPQSQWQSPSAPDASPSAGAPENPPASGGSDGPSSSGGSDPSPSGGRSD
ncbi:hypothetical protein [Micromonospora psammae]|uniref:hypothetical protein n=1 Tax=Micromonospora sp. CPCC 205556 TaxID=3122398 RepID=UPI002FF39BFB